MLLDPLVITLRGVKEPAHPRPDHQAHVAIPLSRALATRWDDDRFFTVYQTPKPAWPRYAKEGTDTEAEGVTVSLTVLDFDTKGHAPLTDEAWDRFGRVVDASPWRARWRYRTTHGARLIYPHEPLPPLEAEARHKALALTLGALDLPPELEWDRRCFNWDRLFRLPYVVREDGKPCPQDPVVEGPETDFSGLEVGPAAKHLAVEQIFRAHPGRAVEELAWKNSKPSKWTTKALKLLENTVAAPYAAGPLAIPFPSSRADHMLAAIGCAAYRLMPDPLHPNKGIEGTTPEHIYALFLLAMDMSQPERLCGGRTLYAEGWKQSLRMWAREEAKQRQALEEHEAEQIETRKAHDDSLAGLASVMATYPNPLVLEPAAVQKFALVSVGNTCYALQRSGYYSSLEYDKATAFSGLARAALPFVILQTEDDKDVTNQEILNHYHTRLRSARYKAGPPDVEAWTDGETFYISPYRLRTDIKPKWHKPIEKFHRLLVGEERYSEFEAWNGHALSFARGALPALVLIGETDVGKSLLAKGYKNVISNRTIADGSVFDHFNYGWHEAFMAHIDEGWKPSAKADGIPDKFRRYVTGEVSGKINTKGKDPRHCEVFPRFLITVNSDRVFDVLLGDPELTHEDDEAICSRILCIDTRGRTEAADYLRSLDRETLDQWIEHDMPQHLLALHEKYGKRPFKGRFLLPGRVPEEVLRRVRSRVVNAPEVGTAVCEMLSDPKELALLQRGGDQAILLMAKDVTDYWKRRASSMMERFTPPRLNVVQVGKALKAFWVPNSGRNGHHGGRRMLDIGAVKAFADLYGFALPAGVTASLQKITV